MKLLRYLSVFREFVLISLLFITIERIVSDKRLANYINPDYHIFVYLALIILLIFAAFAMVLASGRDVNEKPSGISKYIVFIILIILMNLPHDNTLFYEHLQEEREFNLQADSSEKTGKKSINMKLEIRGFVYKSKKLKKDRYIIARLIMYCCAADAGITGLIFDAEKTGVSFKKDEWLELYGHIEMQNAGSSGKFEQAPVLIVESYKKIPPESSPYVYPLN